MAKVSIITASYNYENYIKETIESVLNQTFQDWELIIVDDGSKDNSVSVIKEYCNRDSRIKIFQHENGVNKGLAETIKLGLEKSNCEWVAFLESDDVWLPNSLEEKMYIVNNNPNINFIYSDIEMFGDVNEIERYNQIFYKKVSKKLSKGSPLKDLSPFFVYRNWIYTFSVVMCKKDLFNNCDFNSPLKTVIDYYLWAQIAQKTKIYYLNKKLTLWRIHKKSYLHVKTVDTELEKIFYTKIANFATANIRAKWHGLLKKIKLFRRTIFSFKTGTKSHICVLGMTLWKGKQK